MSRDWTGSLDGIANMYNICILLWHKKCNFNLKWKYKYMSKAGDR